MGQNKFFISATLLLTLIFRLKRILDLDTYLEFV